MTGRRVLSPILPILVLLAMIAGAVSLLASPGAWAQTGDEQEQAQADQAAPEEAAPEEAEAGPPQAALELTIEQSVEEPLDFWISSRADEDDEWSQAEVSMAIQEGGGWRVGDQDVTAGEHAFELRLWQDPADTDDVWLSARLAGELWSDYGTQQLTLDSLSEDGAWNYANLSLALPLRSPAEPNEDPDPDAIVFQVCAPDDQTKTFAQVYVWQLKSDPDQFWITSRSASNQKWTHVKLTLIPPETDEDDASEADETAGDDAAGEQEEASAEADDAQSWNTADLTIAGRRGDIDLRFWQDADDQRNVWLSARSSGAGWEDYGTERWSLDRTSRSGRYWYALQTVTVAVPDNEADEPGASTPNWESWDCNSAPVANAGEDQTVNANSTVTLDGSESSDPDGDALSYAWTGPDDVELTDADTDTATFRATTEQVGETLTFTLTVTDPAGKSDSDEVEITVQAAPVVGFVGGGFSPPPTSPGQQVNQAPTADAGDNQTVAPGATVTLNGSGSTDPEQGALTYSWSMTNDSTYDGGTSISPGNTVNPTFTMPSDADPGETLVFRLTVRDNGGKTATDSVTITTNTPPTADAGADPTVGVGSTVQLNGSSIDPDTNDTSSYSWAQDTTTTDPDYYKTPITLTGGTTATLSFEVPSAARDLKIKFTLTVTDSHNQTGTDEVEVTVTANQPPATPSPNASPASGTPGTTISLTAAAVDDPDTGDTVSYKWTKDSASTYAGSITFADSTARNTSFTVPSDATKDQTIVLKLTASDNQTPSASSSATVTFAVTAELTTGSVTATGARLNLAGWSGKAWWYKSATSGKTTCTSAGTGATVNVTELTPGTAYVFTAYSDNSCSTEIATAAEFKTKPQLTALSDTPTTATLTIAGHTGNWYYKANNAPHKSCSSAVSTSSTNLTGLTEGTSYTYSAYSDSTCATANLLATAPSFTTGISLTASGVTATGATLTIAGHTAQWWYKADTGPHSDCQGPVAASTDKKALTGLTPGTSYTYSAYSASGCASTNQLATASQFKTLAQLTADQVTATTARLTLAGHSEQWWYKSETTTCEGPVAAGTSRVTVTGLSFGTTGTDYVFTAYSNNNCANALDAAPSFTTPVPSLASSHVTKDSAKLTIGNWATADGKWWYKSTTAGATTCTEVSAGTFEVTVTSLSRGTPYTFTAYGDNGCTEFLGSTPSFTTTANQAPSITTGLVAPTNVTAGADHDLSVTATDADGDSLTYTWTGATVPDSTKPYKATAGISATASIGSSHAVNVTVKDGYGGSVSSSVTLTVNNRPPVADARTDKAYALYPQKVNLNGMSSKDPDYDPNRDPAPNWSYSWKKTGGTYTKAITITNAAYGAASFIVPNDASIGDTIIITLTVGDGKGGTDTDSVTINVNANPQQPTNRAPTADPGDTNQRFRFTPSNKNNPVVSLDGSGSSDPDGDTLFYDWSVYAGTCKASITLTNPKSAKPTFTWPSACAVGTSVGLRLTVSDRDFAGGLSDTEDIMVWRMDGVPTVTVNNGAGVTEYKRSDSTSRSFTVNGSASDDPDGDTLDYEWDLNKTGWTGTKPCPTPSEPNKRCPDPTILPAGFSLSGGGPGSTLGNLTVTLGSAVVAATDYSITLRAGSGYATVNLTVKNNTAPGTPTLNPTSLSGRHGQTYGLRASASDSDSGQTLSYKWSVETASCTYLTLSSPNAATTNLTVQPSAPQNATCNVKAKVTDGYGGESEETLVVTISP